MQLKFADQVHAYKLMITKKVFAIAEGVQDFQNVLQISYFHKTFL